MHKLLLRTAEVQRELHAIRRDRNLSDKSTGGGQGSATTWDWPGGANERSSGGQTCEGGRGGCGSGVEKEQALFWAEYESEESERIELLAGKVANFNCTMRQISQQLEEVAPTSPH